MAFDRYVSLGRSVKDDIWLLHLLTAACWLCVLTLSLPRTNLTKPGKCKNPELSNETQRCDHSNESCQWVLSNGGVHVVAGQSSCFCKFYVSFGQRNMAVKGVIWQWVWPVYVGSVTVMCGPPKKKHVSDDFFSPRKDILQMFAII